MGRNIRFLKSDLGALPRNFQTGGGNWQDRVNTMAPYIRAKMARSYGWSIETGTESVSGNQRSRKTGRRRSGNCGNDSSARDDKILEVVRKGEQLQFSDWADFFLENYSKPPIRAEKTHEANERGACTSSRRSGRGRLETSPSMTSSCIFESGFRREFRSGPLAVSLKKDRLKPATVHQELRILRRMMNVAVRKKLLPANPCAGVEFPVKVKGLFRPHYMAWSEQQRIEFQAPEYLRNIDSDHQRDRTSGLQGIDADEKDQWTCRTRWSGFPIRRRRTGSPKCLSRIWLEKHFESRFESPDREPGCFRATESDGASEDAEDGLARNFAKGQGIRTSGSTICGRPMPPGFTRAASRTNGSRSCFGRETPRCSRSTRR